MRWWFDLREHKIRLDVLSHLGFMPFPASELLHKYEQNTRTQNRVPRYITALVTLKERVSMFLLERPLLYPRIGAWWGGGFPPPPP